MFLYMQRGGDGVGVGGLLLVGAPLLPYFSPPCCFCISALFALSSSTSSVGVFRWGVGKKAVVMAAVAVLTKPRQA